MSTHWNVYCKTCYGDQDVDPLFYADDVRNLECAVRELVKLREKLAALGRAFLAVGSDLAAWNVQDTLGHSFEPLWFAQHDGHCLVMRNEYRGSVCFVEEELSPSQERSKVGP